MAVTSGSFTPDTTMTFNARALETRNRRRDLKAAMRAAGGRAAGLRVLADEIADGVPGYLRSVHMDKAMTWAPHCVPAVRNRIIGECGAYLTTTLGALTARQHLVFVTALRDQEPTTSEIGRATVSAAAQMKCDVAPLRAAFERSGKTANEVALELGWIARGRPDGPRVRRALGMRRYWSEGKAKTQQRCSLETATALAAAIGVHPGEVGL